MPDTRFATDEEITYAEKILLQDDETFDSERKEVIKCNESRDVVACPGSGKTTTLLAKLAIIAKRMPLENGRGICVLTHTNVAIDEIKNKLKNQADVLFNYPNFVGTIQSFVDKYFAIPYFNSISEVPVSVIDDDRAYAVMKTIYNSLYKTYRGVIHNAVKERLLQSLPSAEREKMQYDLGFNLFSGLYYDFNRSRYLKSSDDTKAFACNPKVKTYQLADSLRLSCWNKGILRYKDAYSLANAYADTCVGLTDAISNRFAYLFIDEMQDSNSMQSNLLDKLFDSSKVVIQRFGDPHQAIYSDTSQKMIWIPQNNLTISSSIRFGDNIAKVLRTICDCDNKDMAGNPNISSLRPVLLVFNSPEKVLPKYVSILKECKIGDKSVYQIAKEMQEADGLHRSRIKAIGWVGSKKDDGLCIKSYFPLFDANLTNNGKKNPSSLEDFLVKIQMQGVKEIEDRILESFCYVLNMYDIHYSVNSKDVQFTKTRLLAYLKQHNEMGYVSLKKKLGEWILRIMSDDKSTDTQVKLSVTDYINHDLQAIFGYDVSNSKLKQFLDANVTSNFSENADMEINNVYVEDGVKVPVQTVHSVKGETHVATLYMETSYHDKCESERLGEQMAGIACQQEAGKYILQTLRLAYVAISRPRYLLCMAITKEHFDKLNLEQLNKYWDIKYAD
jgi:DNA helicase-2/ATP-dependent DNA helicase PcrA